MRGSLEPIPGYLVPNAGDTLNGVPTHHRIQSHTQPKWWLEMPICLVFGLGEEAVVPRGNPRSTGKTCRLCAHRAERGFKPPTLEVPDKPPDKPPCHPWSTEHQAEIRFHQNWGSYDWEGFTFMPGNVSSQIQSLKDNTRRHSLKWLQGYGGLI